MPAAGSSEFPQMRSWRCERVWVPGSATCRPAARRPDVSLLPLAHEWRLPPEAPELALPKISRCGIGVRGHGEEEPFSLWFCPVRKLMLSAGLLFARVSHGGRASQKLGFFASVRLRQLPLQ